MSKITGYSLWLVPEKGSDADEFLRKLIYKLSLVYKTPLFNPHVTLLSAVEKNEQEMRSKTQTLAKELVPYEIQLTQVGSHGIYFQALFLKVDQSSQVLNAYNMAQKMLTLDKGKYFPHLSLAYGNFSDEQMNNLKKVAEQELKAKNISFLVRDIELWHTESAVSEWHHVATFSFQKT